jgi:hypothetical protein
MGASTALHLARRGRAVTVFDRADAPFCGASRWNEGKIHLGFLYAADSSMATARAVLPGGLAFREQVEQLTGVSLREATTGDGDHYLVHRDSVVPPDAVEAYLRNVAALVESRPDASRYLVDVSTCSVRVLSGAELQELADPEVVVAGYRVPEHSVDTQVVADAFVNALTENAMVELVLGHEVTAVEHGNDGHDTWFVRTGADRHGPFAAVVNALWEGRPAVDLSIRHRPDVDQQFRYRVAMFVRTDRDVDAPCAVMGVGPFGDVKNFGRRNFYLSWYPLGLLASSEGETAPAVPVLSDDERRRLVPAMFDAMRARLPFVERIEESVVEARVEGGWVYSQGNGLLDDPQSTVHRRSRLGVSNVGTYYSVDTGKYSVAPWLAEGVARRIAN